MVQITKLVGVLASAAIAVAVPISGRSSHEMSQENSYAAPQENSYGSYPSSHEESMKSEEKMHEAEPVVYQAEPAMEEHTTVMMHEASTTMVHEAPQSTVLAQEQPAVYGSGAWDKSGYNDCVSQCMAKFGGGSSDSYAMGGNELQGQGQSAGSVGDGATHTVIVAPQQGVLRYVPPFIDANVGDTVMFKWGANGHTVTKSSALLPCNTTGDAPFISGTQDKDFVFTQRINDTNPTYFHCATPGHCSKGMFGIINSGKAEGQSSAGSMLSQSNSSYASYTNQMTGNDSIAASWGSSFDMSSIPEWASEPMMENIMYMRNVIAMNPDLVDESGAVSMGSTSAPLMLPNDVNAVASGDASGDDVPVVAAEEETSADAESTEEAANASGAVSQSNGAGSVTSSKMVMGVVVAFATFLML